MFLKEEKICI